MAAGKVVRRNALTIVGALLTIVGLVFWYQTRDAAPAGFGWFAYAPLGDSIPPQYADYLPVSPWAQWVGAGLPAAAVGLALFTGGIGYRLGVRAGTRGAPPTGPTGETPSPT